LTPDGDHAPPMPREQRVEYAGAIYHAMERGNRRGDIVLDDEDRRRFVETLEEVVESSGWVMYGWVLMSNHYHFLFQTPEPNLVEGMRSQKGRVYRRLFVEAGISVVRSFGRNY
jgi:putative transposase